MSIEKPRLNEVAPSLNNKVNQNKFEQKKKKYAQKLFLMRGRVTRNFDEKTPNLTIPKAEHILKLRIEVRMSKFA
jgi:hypothetical protein